MGYRNLRACVADLERTRQLVRIDQEIDPDLEAAEVQRRVYQAGGPAVYFARVKGCAFPMVSNLFGTRDRIRYLFRDTLDAVRHLVELKVDPAAFWKSPWRYRDVPATVWRTRPKCVRRGPILAHGGLELPPGSARRPFRCGRGCLGLCRCIPIRLVGGWEADRRPTAMWPAAESRAFG